MTQLEMKQGEWLFRLFAFVVTFAVYTVINVTMGMVLMLTTAFPDSSNLVGTMVAFGALFISPAYWLLIVVVPLARRGQTFGLKWFGLVLVDATGRPASRSQVFLREALHVVSGILFVGVVGWLWCLFDEEGRTLFDKATRTRVVQSRAQWKWVNEFRQFKTEQAKSEAS